VTRSKWIVQAGCCLLGVLAGVTPLHAQGVLERMRLATREGRNAPPSPARPASSSSSDALVGLSAGATEGTEYLLLGAAVVATSPWWGPHVLFGDDLGVVGYFPGCPYALPWSGYMNIDFNATKRIEEQEAQFGAPDYQKTWAVRFSLEDGHDFGALNRIEGKLFLDTSSRFGVQSRWSYYQENDGSRHDESLLGDTELTFRFVQGERIQMHTGLGFRLLADRSDTRAGVNFLYGADLYPIKPLIVSSSIDLGNLDAAFLVHGRCTLGVAYRNWELLTGYDFLRVGSVNLQGPLLGVRTWF
jgi:hypothetical protein